MIPSDILAMTGIYQNHRVVATYEDQRTLCGILQSYNSESGVVQIDDVQVRTQDLYNLEYLGILGADDYQTYHQVGAIDDVYKFSIGDLVTKDCLEFFLYHEFECQVACHLYIQNGTILATDVRLVSTAYVANREILSAKNFLYRYHDGTLSSGHLDVAEDGNFTLRGEALHPDQIVEVTMLPEINDTVIVVGKDGSSQRGLVCAIQDGSFNIFADGVVTNITYEQICQLRYVGVITSETGGRIMIEKQYVSKLPYYLRNKEDAPFFKKGAEVSFVAGANTRGMIAKDVVLEQKVSKIEETEYYGVLLTVNFMKENGFGYIGNRYVAKSCGKPVSGRTRFLRSQMDFDIEYNKAYIIKYTASESPGKNLRIVSHMEVHKVLDISKIGIVEVSDEGEIHVVPLFRASIERFENRDVDVVCTDGSTFSGILQSHDEEGVTVVQGGGETAERYLIPFDQIEDILLIGTVTQFYQNGTGYVDNAFFFHINEMEQSVDAQFVRRGIQLIFTLENARKGNFVNCGNIRILPEKKLDVFVLSYQNKKYTVVDAEKYGKDVRFFGSAYEVPYASYNQFRDLKHEDYHAIMTLQRKAGVLECTYLRTLSNDPKLCVGIVTNVNQEQNTVTLLSVDSYRKKNDAKVYPLALRSGVERLSNLDEKDYKVLYSLSVQNHEYAVTIFWVDKKDAYDKCYFGYLEKYLEDKVCGFITPDAYYDQWPRPRNCGVYCRPSAFCNPPQLHELVDTKYVFRVCYTLDSATNSKQNRRPAKSVWFQEKVERQKPALIQHTVTQTPVQAQAVSEDINLHDAYPAGPGEDVRWQFGIILAFSPNFTTINIYQSFSEKKLLINVPASNGKAQVQVSGEYAERVNTFQSAYLVRFATEGADNGDLKFDYSHPLEFLREFRKAPLKELSIQGETLHIETGPHSPKPVPAPVSILLSEEVTSYCPGETILIQKEDQTWYAGNVDSVKDGQFVFTDGQTLKLAEADVIRFGVLTSFNENMTVGYLNGKIPFGFADMESRTFNMIKTAKKQQLLWYTCQDGRVCHVERITKDFLEKLPFQWHYGMVTKYIETSDERCVFVDEDIRYLMTVSTGGYIWGLIKSDSIVRTAVFVKTIFCPYSQGENTEIRQYALDIHSEQETAVIRYDAVSDSYLAAQNATKSVTVEGNGNMLSSLVDSQASISYRLTEDGRGLQAYIDGSDDDADWSGETVEEDLDVSKALVDSSLVQYLLQKVDLTSMQLPGGVELSSEGWPTNPESAVRVILHFGKKSSRDFGIKKAVAMVALMERLPEEQREETLAQLQYRSVEAMLWKVLNRHVRAVGREHDCLLGEYSYYATTILRNIHSLDRQREEIYKFFLQDFYSRIEVMEKLRRLSFSQRDRRSPRLRELFKRDVLAGGVDQLVAHMISLDEVAFQYLVVTENVLEQNDALQEQILAWGKTVDNTQSFESAATLIMHLRLLHRNDKSRFTKELFDIARGMDVLYGAERILNTISGRFLRLIAADDTKRFTTLLEVCQSINANRSAGYLRYQSALAQAWTKCSELQKSAEEHLTQESTEMLLNTGLMDAVLGEISRELNALYSNPEYMPDIRCTSNDSEILPAQKNLILLVENGGTGRTNLQGASNIKLHLEVLGGLAGDSIPETIVLRENVLLAGAATVVLDGIPLDLSSLDGDAFSISVSVEYDCYVGFQEGEVKKTQTADCGILEFQIRGEQNIVKDAEAVNYYSHPAQGNPLKETDADDCSMFFGRKEELEEIWNSLIDENQRLREGSAIILFGQKKCGKTSLINQIIGRMKVDPAISQQAITISVKDILEFNGGITGLASFTLNFYQNILNMLKIELMLRHKEIKELLRENSLEIPNLRECPGFEAAEFQNFFLQFSALTQGKYRIVLVMDEFTRLCTTILGLKSTHPEYQGIPNFIKLFSSMGFVQIVIGHPNMMIALSQLGIINHTAEFAKRIELSALKEGDARKLIREPMIRSFGFDVYQTRLGERAVEKLLGLSGCHPSVLMKLCDQMFKHYVKTKHSQILIHDVEKMLSAYLPQLEANTTFDIMVVEDGDATAFFDNLPTYRYLTVVAMESLRSNNRDCDINIICQDMGEQVSREIRETLISRRVLEAGNGRIKIPIELFVEYIRYKYETH